MITHKVQQALVMINGFAYVFKIDEGNSFEEQEKYQRNIQDLIQRVQTEEQKFKGLMVENTQGNVQAQEDIDEIKFTKKIKELITQLEVSQIIHTSVVELQDTIPCCLRTKRDFGQLC